MATSPSGKIKFARRTSSGRIVSLPRDEGIDFVPELNSSSGGPSDYMNYTVQMPPTPDNQPQPGPSPSDSNPRTQYGSNNTRVISRRGEGETDGLGRSMSVMKSSNMSLIRSQTGDFDHNRWLFETSGTYGIGNAFWQPPDGGYNDEDEGVTRFDFMDKPWKPLTRKVKVSAAVMSPYRYAQTIVFGEIEAINTRAQQLMSHQADGKTYLE